MSRRTKDGGGVAGAVCALIGMTVFFCWAALSARGCTGTSPAAGGRHPATMQAKLHQLREAAEPISKRR